MIVKQQGLCLIQRAHEHVVMVQHPLYSLRVPAQAGKDRDVRRQSRACPKLKDLTGRSRSP